MNDLTDNPSTSMNDEIILSERFEVEDNVLIDNSEAVCSSRFSNNVGDEIGSSENSKRLYYSSGTTTRNYNQSKESNELANSQTDSFEDGKWEIVSLSDDNLEAYNYQKTCDQKVEDFLESMEGTVYIQDTIDYQAGKNVTTIKKARNSIGEVIFYDNDSNVIVTRSETPENSIIEFEMEVVDNTNNKTSENIQELQETMQLDGLLCRSPIQYIADTNIMEGNQDLQNKSFKENAIELCSKFNAFQMPKTPQLLSLKFDYNLLTEDISPYERCNNSNATIPGSNLIDESSFTNESVLEKKSTKEAIFNTSALNPRRIPASTKFGILETIQMRTEEISEEPQPTRVCPHGEVCFHGSLRSISSTTFKTTSEKPKTEIPKRKKQSSSPEIPRESKRKYLQEDSLLEDIYPYERYNNSNVTIPGSNQIDQSSLTNESVLENKSAEEATGNTSALNPRGILAPTKFRILETIQTRIEEISEEPQPTKVCPHGKVCLHGSLRSISSPTFKTTFEKPKTEIPKRKKSSSPEIPRESKRKCKAPTYLQELEVFVNNSIKERHPSLSMSKGTCLKLAAFVLDIMDRIGDEASILVAMTVDKQIDSRVLKYAIKMCLERIKVEADVVTGKRYPWLF